MKPFVRHFALALLALVLVACANDKGPAEAALKSATAAVDGVRADASRYASAEFGKLEASLKAAQDSFAKGDYKAVMTAATEIAAGAKAAAAAAVAKKDELTKAWNDAAAGVPEMMGAIGSRLDILGAAKKLPAGMDKATLDGLKAAYADLGTKFDEAKKAFEGGDLVAAADAGKMIKEKGTALAQSLGLTAAEPAK
jgi:hypothetical protein